MNVQKTISTYFAEGNSGRAVVVNAADGPMIEYYDAQGHHFFTQDFPGKTISDVEMIAEDWALGYKTLNG